MSDSAEKCFICGHGESTDADRHYRRCMGCGHETRKSRTPAVAIVNDSLGKNEVARFGLLDRFKRQVLLACTVDNSFLLDVGTASGKFLYHNRRYFRTAAGLEVTPACVDFASRLGLAIHEDISTIREVVSVATFWHSMEHLPADLIDRFLSVLHAQSTDTVRVIVSVPNAGSWMAAGLGEHSAYYDAASHEHQFTARSLGRLMGRHGFVRERSFHSLVYAGFGYLQGLMNVFLAPHNYLYYRKKRRWTFGLTPGALAFHDGLGYLWALVAVVPSVVLALVDSLLKDKGAVLTLCYKKQNRL